MAEINFREFDKAQDWLQRLRDPKTCVDFGLIQPEDREPLIEFLKENGFIQPDTDHEIYWWNGRELKSKYTIDIYLPVYIVTRPFRLREQVTHDKTCSWTKDEYLLLDYDLRMWYSEKEPEKL